MIFHRDEGPAGPWPPAESPVWVILETTGEDSRIDRLQGIEARAIAIEGQAGHYQWSAPSSEPQPASQQAAWQGLLDFAGQRPMIVAQAHLWHVWARKFGPHSSTVLGLDEWRALTGLPSQETASDIEALHAGFEAGLTSIQRWDEVTLGIWARGLHESAFRFEATDPEASKLLQWILRAINRPQAATPDEASETTPDRVTLGWLESAIEAVGEIEYSLQGLTPLASQVVTWDSDEDVLPPSKEGLTPFPKEDLSLVENIFDQHLPERLCTAFGGSPDKYLRPTQRDVALRVGKNLGQSGLLLVHAPTGTGKTLAYLIPTLIWSLRHGIRTGIATYTRALQEQAMFAEVPRAIQALQDAGIEDVPRVALLKGRENYLCWRAFLPQTPEAGDDGEAWLAWTRLFAFARADESGDLDRLPTHPPIRLRAPHPFREAMARLIRQTRARKGCCSRPKDRSTCCADLARRRAERSHLVVTNQSFVLARQEFLRHVIFDECEHLHDGAVSAWSHRFEFEEVRRTLARLHRPQRGKSRAPLNRLMGVLPMGGASQEFVKKAVFRWQNAQRALLQLEEEAELFDDRRNAEAAGRSAREWHSYLRERMDQGEAAGLLQARLALGSAMAQLEGDLDRVMEATDANAVRGQASIRRQLELGRAELIEWGEALGACLPLSENGPSFPNEVFYDIERRASGQLGLVARVLLPFEALGRFYYPDLASGAFLSATTYLRGSFECTQHYLGLKRCEEPAEDEERVGRRVNNFRVPEVFDYERVLVAVPRDSPSVRAQKSQHLDYITEFVATLCERTGGRALVLFTNLEDVRRVGQALESRLLARGLLLLYQGMPHTSKEELSRRFRERQDSVLLGVDTFWFGADFPGDTLQYLVIARLPYGVPDRYHFAQCTSLGENAQRNQVYMPRALAKFRQGFGRLMRRVDDRGCVILLDKRILEPRHRDFLRELPLAGLGDMRKPTTGAHLVRGPLERIWREIWQHMGLQRAIESTGIPLGNDAKAKKPGLPERTLQPQAPPQTAPPAQTDRYSEDRAPFTPPIDVDPTDLPF